MKKTGSLEILRAAPRRSRRILGRAHHCGLAGGGGGFFDLSALAALAAAASATALTAGAKVERSASWRARDRLQVGLDRFQLFRRLDLDCAHKSFPANRNVILRARGPRLDDEILRLAGIGGQADFLGDILDNPIVRRGGRRAVRSARRRAVWRAGRRAVCRAVIARAPSQRSAAARSARPAAIVWWRAREALAMSQHQQANPISRRAPRQRVGANKSLTQFREGALINSPSRRYRSIMSETGPRPIFRRRRTSLRKQLWPSTRSTARKGDPRRGSPQRRQGRPERRRVRRKPPTRLQRNRPSRSLLRASRRERNARPRRRLRRREPSAAALAPVPPA